MIRTLKTSDVATMLSVSPATVRRWCDKGTLKFIRVNGGRFLVKVESIDALLGTKHRTVSQRALRDEAHAAAARLGIQLRDAM